MNTVISVVSALACVFSLDAQITATLNRLPDGQDEVRIRNNSATDLVAFAVTANRVPQRTNPINGPFVVYSDPLVDQAVTPLPGSEERVVMSGYFTQDRVTLGKSYFGGLKGPIVTAGIFADGTTTGDPVLLTRLLLRRSNMLLAVETTLETLSDAGRHNIPRDQLIAQFKKMANSMRHWYLPTEQQLGVGLYQSIVGKLMNLPEEPLGSPFPPPSFVVQETAILTRQRVKLLESRPSLADSVLTEYRPDVALKSK
jgi:hypothetical protein